MFITCGEALFDIFAGPAADGSPFGLSMNAVIGGSPLNVGLGMARMGHDSSMFTRVSKDLFGQRLRAFMKHNGISDRYVVETDRNTTLAVIEKRPDGQPNYSFYFNGTADCSMEQSDIPARLRDEDRIIHFGSFATLVEPTASTLSAFARREKDSRFISFDPNIRAMVIPDLDLWRAKADEMLAMASFVKASDEDIELLYPGTTLEAFLDRALAAGVDVACVTKGADGALAASADGRRVSVPGRTVKVEDTVGAGDTFQAASLHFIASAGLARRGQARSVDLQAMAEFAVAAAAITCSRMGADLPTRAEVEALVTA